MKIFLLCIVLCCSILVGIKIKEYFKRRQVFYKNFCMFCETLQNKISFNDTKINLIIEDQFRTTSNKDFKIFLSIFLEYVTNEISKNELESCFIEKFSFLQKIEQQEYLSFITNFGGLCKDEELSSLSNYLLRFKKKLEDIEVENKKYSDFYFKLFLIFGLMIVVIFI